MAYELFHSYGYLNSLEFHPRQVESVLRFHERLRVHSGLGLLLSHSSIFSPELMHSGAFQVVLD